MTKSELKDQLAITKNDYLQKQENLRKLYLKEKQTLLDEYAKQTARFKVGDILKCYDMFICVESIHGVYDEVYGMDFYVTYRGHVLTKQLKPRKDGLETSFYDDGREIIKIEK